MRVFAVKTPLAATPVDQTLPYLTLRYDVHMVRKKGSKYRSPERSRNARRQGYYSRKTPTHLLGRTTSKLPSSH
jgi:hypothetical protein